MTFKVPPYWGVKVVAVAEVAVAALGAVDVVVADLEVAAAAELDVDVVELLQPATRNESTRMTTRGIKYFFTFASSWLFWNIFC
jgi:hypothetical protein